MCCPGDGSGVGWLPLLGLAKDTGLDQQGKGRAGIWENRRAGGDRGREGARAKCGRRGDRGDIEGLWPPPRCLRRARPLTGSAARPDSSCGLLFLCCVSPPATCEAMQSASGRKAENRPKRGLRVNAFMVAMAMILS